MKSQLFALIFCLFALVATPLEPAEALENTVKVCIELPSGSLQLKTAALGAGMCPTISTPHPVISVFSFWFEGTSQFAEEYSGRALFSCYDSNGSTVIQQLDVTGSDKGAKRKTYTPGASPSALVSIPAAVEATAAAGQVQWVVKDGGEGSGYTSRLAECRTLAGYPPS